MKKTVILPIEVPQGNYCHDMNDTCEHFTNEGGYNDCDLDLNEDYQLKSWNGKIKKPKKCKRLSDES